MVGTPLWCPRSKGTRLTQILSRKTRDLGAAHGKDFVILACTVLIALKGVMDIRTDVSAMAKTREALHAVAHKNHWPLTTFKVSDNQYCWPYSSDSWASCFIHVSDIWWTWAFSFELKIGTSVTFWDLMLQCWFFCAFWFRTCIWRARQPIKWPTNNS